MKVPTLEQLRRWTPEERLRVRQRATKLDIPEAKATAALIDESGLPLRSNSGGMPQNHPLYVEMEEIIWSEQGSQPR